MNLQQKILSSISYRLRRRINDPIIVIESDDWGLERALTHEAIEWTAATFEREKFSRWTTDALESLEDLTVLFDLLDSYKTKFAHPPVITANFITHNVGIDTAGNLAFLPLSEGFHPALEDVRPLYKAGIQSGYIHPQLHGFSHYNTRLLAAYIQTEEAKTAFQQGFLLARSTIKGNLDFLHGEMSIANPNAAAELEKAQHVFSECFGFPSLTFIPPTYILDIQHMTALKKTGVQYLQAGNRLTNNRKMRYFHPALRKIKGIFWGLRNARLDPHPGYNFNHEQCLRSIDGAFKAGMPAIIDFHRVNFSGRFAPEHRNRTMIELRSLLDGIQKNWPDARFMGSHQLIPILNGAEATH